MMKYIILLILLASCSLFRTIEVYQTCNTALSVYSGDIKAVWLAEIKMKSGEVISTNTPIIRTSPWSGMGYVMGTANAATANAVQGSYQGCVIVRTDIRLSDDGKMMEVHVCAGPTLPEVDYLVFHWQAIRHEGDWHVQLNPGECLEDYPCVDEVCEAV